MLLQYDHVKKSQFNMHSHDNKINQIAVHDHKSWSVGHSRNN